MAWVFASTSGLIRTETGANLSISAATALSRSSSGSDSTLKHRIPTSSARRISARLLPTPEKMIFSAEIPARSARSSSPSDTTSAPMPFCAAIASIAWLELAFMA